LNQNTQALEPEHPNLLNQYALACKCMRSRRRGIRLGFTFTLALCSVGRILRRGQGGVGPKDGVSQDHAAHSRGQGRILL